MSEQSTVDETVAPSGSSGLEVDDEPGVYWCARHRKTKTRLRCGRCEAPICPKCTVYGPTGARCRTCLSNRGSHMYQVGAGHLLLTFALSAVLGLVGAVLIQATGIYLLIFFAPAIGGGLGKIITRVTKGKRGPVIAGASSAGIAIGTLAVFAFKWLALQRASRLPYAPSLDFVDLMTLSGGLYLLIFLVAAIVGVWYWLK